MWLYFNYYGKHLVVVQSSDEAYYDYLSGDPLGQNQYIIPDSNIEGGYGLFTSNYSKAFFLNIRKRLVFSKNRYFFFNPFLFVLFIGLF